MAFVLYGPWAREDIEEYQIGEKCGKILISGLYWPSVEETEERRGHREHVGGEGDLL